MTNKKERIFPSNFLNMWFPNIYDYTSKLFEHFNRTICFPIITVVYYLWSSLKETWLWPVLVLKDSSNTNNTVISPSMSSSYSDLPPKWINPCGIQWPQQYSDFNKLVSSPTTHKTKTSKELVQAVKIARENALDFKIELLNSQFPSIQKMDVIKNFEESISEYREVWIPEIPNITESIFKLVWSMNISNNLKLKGYQMFFKYLQYFAVGFEQIISDQVLYDGMYIQKFQNIEQDLIQLLCLLQMEMYIYKTLPHKHVSREVMTDEYRNIPVKSSRDLRDYFILRDYIKLIELAIQLLNCMEEREREKSVVENIKNKNLSVNDTA